MKKNFASFTKGYLIPGLMSCSIYFLPLPVSAHDNTVKGPSHSAEMKDGSYVPASAFAVAMLDPKFLKKFEKSFPAASGLKWVEEGRVTRFYFKDAGKTVRAVFSKNGTMESMLCYYDAALLPKEVANSIRNEYKGYRMTKVTEVDYAAKKAYIVQLEGIDDWLQVRWLDGEITLHESFLYAR